MKIRTKNEHKDCRQVRCGKMRKFWAQTGQFMLVPAGSDSYIQIREYEIFLREDMSPDFTITEKGTDMVPEGRKNDNT